MSKRLRWIVVAALIAVSCTELALDSTTTSTIPVPSTSTSTTVGHGPLPGRLVVTDVVENVVVTDTDGSNSIQITDDAGVNAIYIQPVWLSDPDTLAWGQATDEGLFGVGIANTETGERAVVETAGLPFYLYFSPAGDRLAVLNNGPSAR